MVSYVQSGNVTRARDSGVPAVAVVDDSLPRSSDLDTLAVAPDRHSPWHAKSCSFRCRDVPIRGSFGGAGYPRRLGLDVLHEHEAEAGIENRPRLGRAQGGSVWLVSPDIPHAESISVGVKRRCRIGRYPLRGINAAYAVGCAENVAGECHG